MSIPAQPIIKAFKTVSKLAEALGHKNVSTVHHWKQSGKIPHWRIHEIREAAKRENVTLPDDFDMREAS